MSDPQAAPDVVSIVIAALADDEPVSRAETKAAVKAVLADLVSLAPGRSVEVRVPPFAAVQLIAGATHRRGTPPALVQMSARTLLLIASGDLDWHEAVASGEVRASGERSDLSHLFPLYN